MKAATLFPDSDDDIHDSADDWKTGAAMDEGLNPQASRRRQEAANEPRSNHPLPPAVHRTLSPATANAGFQRPPGPMPYHNRTRTSRAAAESARSFVRSQVVRVSEFIASQGEHGATDKEIQTALNIDGNSQRPRRVWLRDHGFIKPKGEPAEIAVRAGSTVWVSVRPLELPSVPFETKGHPKP